MRDAPPPAARARAGLSPWGAAPPSLSRGPVCLGVLPEGCAGSRRGGNQDRVVVRGELRAALLLGHIEVAEDFVPDPDRGAKEAVHRRMVWWEAKGVGVTAEVT